MCIKNPEYIASIEKFVGSFIQERGISPTIKEIADGVGMSKSNVAEYISHMRETGQLKYTGRRSIVKKEFVQTVSAQIPWAHNVLIHQIESCLYERQEKAKKITNFENRLPSTQSELAIQTMKDLLLM